MERESFEDEEVAELLNRDFVSIKVDREERPDVDHLYMTVCQAMTGHGGWPLTVLLTPDRKPFFAGTYFPRRRAMGRYGLMDILTQLGDKWRETPEDIADVSEKVTQELGQSMLSRQPGDWDVTLAGAAASYPSGHAMLLLAGLAAESGGPDIVITGDPGDEETRRMLTVAQQANIPHGSVRFVPQPQDGRDAAADLPQHLADKRSIGGKPTAYVCRNFACEAPVTSADALRHQLGGSWHSQASVR